MTRQSWSDRILAAYARAPDHPAKLRIVYALLRVFNKQHVVTQTAFGRMDLDVNDLVQREILLRGSYEPRTIARLQTILRPRGTFIDIGAHVGQYSLVAASVVGAGGRVIAVEPNPVVCASLVRNRAYTEPAARFDIVCAALSDKSSLIPFGIVSAGNLGSTRMTTPDRTDAIFSHTLTFHDLVEALEIGPIHAAKIDVEGAELLVVRGFTGVDRARWPDHILFEFLPEMFDYFSTPGELLSFFRDHNYVLRDVAGTPFQEGAELPEFNLWATKAELAD